MFTRIGTVLKNSPRRSKSPGSLLALQIRQAARVEINKILENYPEQISKNVRVKSYRKGTLSIVCPQLLSAELHMRSERLIKDINKGLGERIVLKIRYSNK